MLIFFFKFFLSDCLNLCDPQIREKLTQLQEKRDMINNKWQDKMDHLQIGTTHRLTNHNSLFYIGALCRGVFNDTASPWEITAQVKRLLGLSVSRGKVTVEIHCEACWLQSITQWRMSSLKHALCFIVCLHRKTLFYDIFYQDNKLRLLISFNIALLCHV